jgi:hypothetical protein
MSNFDKLLKETPVYIVFNDITQKVEEKNTAPNFGNPNATIQQAVLTAYSGGITSSVGASAVSIGIMPSALGDPASSIMTAAQSALNAGGINDQMMNTIQGALGNLSGLGAVPGMISSMMSHADNILGNMGKSMEAMMPTDNIFAPDLVGTASELTNQGKCNDLSKFMGSVQGNFNTSLNGITNNLGILTNSLVSTPLSLINQYTASAAALTQILTQNPTNAAIMVATSALTPIVGNIGTALGSAGGSALGLIAGSANKLTTAINSEISNFAKALGIQTQNPFKLQVPNVNPCMQAVMNSGNIGINFNVGPVSIGISI